MYVFVEDTHDAPDIYPFDVEPPQGSSKPVCNEDPDSKVAALHEALQVYFEGMPVDKQDSILRWQGPLRFPTPVPSERHCDCGMWLPIANGDACWCTFDGGLSHETGQTTSSICAW